MTMIGSISAKITADDTEFLAAMGRVKTSLSSQATQLRSSANNYAKWGAAAAAAAAVAGSALVKNTADGIRELKTFSQVANTSTQDFQKLAYGAKTMGIEQDKLADILKDVNDRVGDFGATGGGAMADFFTNIAPKVGVTYENFKKLSGKDALQLYVSSLEKANLSQADMTFYMEAMASDSTQLLPLLKNNGEAMGVMATEADNLGLALSDIDIAKVEQANKQLDKSSSIIGGALQDATVSLAPIITGISESLQDAAMKAGGFGATFDKVIDGAASVIGVFADGIRGIQVIIEGLNVAFWGVAHVVNLAFKEASEGVDYFVNTTKNSINSVIEGLNMLGAEIPKLELANSAATNFLTDQAAASQQALTEAMNKFDELALKELPSESIKRWLAEVRASANEAAVAVAAASSGQQVGEEGGGGSTGGLNDDEKKKLQEKVEAIRQSNLSEVEALKEKFALEAEVLAQARLNNIGSEEEFQQQMVAISQKYADEKTAIEQKAKDKQKAIDDIANKQKINSAKTIFGGLSSLMNTESRKLFEIGKTAALANSLINAYEAVTSAYKGGLKVSGGNPVVGAAFAAAAGAAQFATIQSIQSQSFSKGGAGSSQSYSNGLPVTNTQEAGGGQPSSRQVNISLTGSSFGAGSIRDLIGEINEAVGDGVNLKAG
ncbi:tail length tape-measure protein 1 [Pseudoalteromonas phage PS_L5]|nr:tail length tape-measure protein 1 [Pseudoalteromonas phage PS_L5]